MSLAGLTFSDYLVNIVFSTAQVCLKCNSKLVELLFILKKIPLLFPLIRDFPGGLGSKQSPYNARKLGLIPGLGRSSGAGNGYPLQDSCMENPMDRGAWWATGYSCKRLDTSELLAHLVISLKHSRALEISLQCLFHSVLYSFMVW